MNTRVLARLGGGCLLLAAASSAFGTEPGHLMKMTTTMHMQMAGMPAMPPMSHTMTVCGPARKPDPEQLVQPQKGCTVSNVHQSGDTVSYHMACTGDTTMQGDGRFQTTANGDVHGSFHMIGTQQGRSMVMDSKIDGERIGDCDYTPSASSP